MMISKYKNKYEYDLFLKLALDSFDLYTLALVFYQIANYLMNFDNYKNFCKDIKELSKQYILTNYRNEN